MQSKEGRSNRGTVTKIFGAALVCLSSAAICLNSLRLDQNAAATLKNKLSPETSPDYPSNAAETYFAEGERLRTEWRAESFRKAIEKYESALELWKAAGRNREVASAHRAIGDCWFSLAEPLKALQSYKYSLLLSKRLGDRTGEAEALNAIGQVHLSFGENVRALSYFNEALRLSRRVGSLKAEAGSINNIGEAYYALRNLSESLKFHDQALTMWQQLEDKSGQAHALLNFGYTYSDLSDTENALSSYNRALSLWRAVDNPRGEALTLTALGHLNSKLGDKQAALNLYGEATILFEPIGDKTGQAYVFNGLGYVYEELGDIERALENYTKALKLFQSTSYREGEAGSLYKIGKAYLLLGHYEEALNYLQRSRLVSKAIADKRMEALPVGLMGQTFLALGKEDEALHYYKQALLLNRVGSDKREEAYTLGNIGNIQRELGRIHQALTYFNEALLLNRATRDRFGECSTRYSIALVKRELGRLDEAREELKAALELAESLRTNVASSDLRVSYFASVRQVYELQIDILMQMHKQDVTANFNERAFEISERARARSLLESLREAHVDILQRIDISLLKRQQFIEQQLNLKADYQAQLASAKRITDAESVEKEISQLTEQYDEVRAQIRTSSPHYAALTQPQPLSLKEIQQRVVDKNSLLLEYSLGDERSYLWAVTNTEVSSFELPGRLEVETAARNVYASLTANQPLPGETFEERRARVNAAQEELRSQIANLSRILLDPVAKKLGRKRLLIVADGALQYIPFQILTKSAQAMSSADGGLRPLVADHEILNQPSASVLALLMGDTTPRNKPSNSVAVFADPVFEADDPRIKPATSSKTPVTTSKLTETELSLALRDVFLTGNGTGIPRLQASRLEADAIMSVAPWWSAFKATGFEASRPTAMKPELSNYRVLHFATHGLLNNQHPELSGVVLSLFDEEGKPQDGFLRLHDIYNLKLPIDLVVLSACNTGLGKDINGEGLIGLTRGFMYAGALSVVASLWKVDDEATAELMRHFYGFMFREGLSPAAALRNAQLEMSKQKRWQSPYYWSGFIIQGLYVDGEKPSDSVSTRLILGSALFALLVTAALLIWRRRRNPPARSV